ncbi:MAG: AGE family epimerase/isomerase [Halobacteriaceae archaeon]
MDDAHRDPAWLRAHALDVLAFYYPDCVAEDGGYVHGFSDVDGTVYDDEHHHLVGTARFVFDFAVGRLLDGPDYCDGAAAHGLSFLRSAHRDDAHGGYLWLLDDDGIADGRKYCYGHAFALVAEATALRAGVSAADADAVTAAADVLDERFRDPNGLYRPTCDRDWGDCEAYRGQNANMHTCEAFLAAHEATGESAFRDRSLAVAEGVARDLADAGDGLVWEHYTADWEHDWTYNRDDLDDLFRPWGYLVGHQTEWAKLLGMLDRHVDADWLVDRARHLFETAVETCWDDDRGGLYYSFDREGEVINERKYFWVAAETLAAAAVLYERTGDDAFLTWYDRVWTHAREQFVSDALGIWYRVLEPSNAVADDVNLTPRVKADYHVVNACYEARRALDEAH